MVPNGAGGYFLSSNSILPTKLLSCLWTHSKTAWDTSALSLSTSPKARQWFCEQDQLIINYNTNTNK